MNTMEHDAYSSKLYKEDCQALSAELIKAEAKLAKMKEVLRVIAYPRRGTEEETMFTYVEDIYRYIESNFSLEDLE